MARTPGPKPPFCVTGSSGMQDAVRMSHAHRLLVLAPGRRLCHGGGLPGRMYGPRRAGGRRGIVGHRKRLGLGELGQRRLFGLLERRLFGLLHRRVVGRRERRNVRYRVRRLPRRSRVFGAGGPGRRAHLPGRQRRRRQVRPQESPVCPRVPLPPGRAYGMHRRSVLQSKHGLRERIVGRRVQYNLQLRFNQPLRVLHVVPHAGPVQPGRGLQPR
jgi:hypothetical protein